MRVLVLSKRQYTGRDLLDDRYGRLYQLPVQLAGSGAEVGVVTTSYRRRGDVSLRQDGVIWTSVDALPFSPRMIRAVGDEAARFAPDVIWASSDVAQLSAAIRIGRRLSVPVVLDVYDDYESFGLTRIPGLKRHLRRCCATAHALTVVSSTLRDEVVRRGASPMTVTVVPNGVSQPFLSPIPREHARNRLGLPVDQLLVGTAGALSTSRGILDLLDAMPLVRQRVPGATLVVAGPRDRRVARALAPSDLDLGVLAPTSVPLLFGALDVGVVCNRDSAFGRSCHPLKLVEMAACRTPVVAADVGEVSRLLKSDPRLTYPAGDATALADRIVAQLLDPVRAPAEIARPWRDVASDLFEVLERAITGVAFSGASGR